MPCRWKERSASRPKKFQDPDFQVHVLFHIVWPSSVYLRTLWKLGWFTKITRVEISILLLTPWRSISQVKKGEAEACTHGSEDPWLQADSFFQQELCWLKNLLPTSCPQLLVSLPLAGATEMHVCIWVVKTNPASSSSPNRKSLVKWCYLGWNRLGSAQKQLSWPVWVAGGHCSPWGMNWRWSLFQLVQV